MLSRFYCQFCKVGTDSVEVFTTHLYSLGHQIQKRAYEGNPNAYTEFLSDKFARQFMKVLFDNFGTVAADVNDVYLAFTENSSLTRLTKTKWTTLDDFLQWLRDNFQGKCSVVKDDYKTTVQIVDVEHFRSGEHQFQRHSTFESNKCLNKRQVDDQNLDQNEKISSRKQVTQASTDDIFNINQLVEDAFSEKKKNTLKSIRPWTLKRNRVSVSINPPKEKMLKKFSKSECYSKIEDAASNNCKNSSCRDIQTTPWGSSRQIVLKELMKELDTLRERNNRRGNWLFPGIQVEVTNTRLGRKYLGQQAVVVEVMHLFTALLRFLHDDSYLYADQCDLQTVVPAVGDKVLFVNGGYRGHTGILKEQLGKQDDSAENKRFSVVIDKGVLNGRLVSNVNHCDIARLLEMDTNAKS